MALAYPKHIKKNGEKRVLPYAMLLFSFLISAFAFSQKTIDIAMVRVDGGTYQMGSNDGPKPEARASGIARYILHRAI
jgi:hypothetical protein